MGAVVHRELSVPLDTGYLIQVRKAVFEVCVRGPFQPSEVNLIALAVDEAVANVMEHAYRGLDHPKKKEIVIVLNCDPTRFEALIRDHGRPFDPNLVPTVDIQDHIRRAKSGGLGVFLMRRIMDEVNYSFKQCCHNELQMIKYIDNRT